MAISVRSTLSEKERIFTIAVDHCGADGAEGILYRGESQQGRHFGSFLELADVVEQAFRQMRYPREVLAKRFFGRPRNVEKAVTERTGRETAVRREGTAATWLLRVRQRQNASWQGTLINKKDGRRLGFRSFLELMRQLDSISDTREDRNTSRYRQIVDRYLGLAFKDSRLQPSVQELLPGIVTCQLDCEGQSNMFLLRIMFYEHFACQGVLYWKEKHCQQSFRSFLELIQMMGQAIQEDDERWEETAS